MPTGSISVTAAAANDTVCPVCWESVHSDKPVGVTTGCGHIWHQECYRSWHRKGDYIFESSTNSSSNSHKKKRYTLNSHLNCLICEQPTRSFVDLFIRLPSAVQSHKDLVTKVEYEFNTVSRRTQMSLEKEIARREFEQTWLQEERQLSQAARQRAEQRHALAIQKLEDNLKELKFNYERKSKSIAGRRRRGTPSGGSSLVASESPVILQFQPIADADNNVMNQSISFSALQDFNFLAYNEESISFLESEITTTNPWVDMEQPTNQVDLTPDDIQSLSGQQRFSIFGVASVTGAPNAIQWQEPLGTWGHADTDDQSTADRTTSSASVARPPTQGNKVASLIQNWEATIVSSPNRAVAHTKTSTASRASRNDAIVQSREESRQAACRIPLNTSRSRLALLCDEILPLVQANEQRPASDNEDNLNDQEPQPFVLSFRDKDASSRKRKGSLKICDIGEAMCEGAERRPASTTTSSTLNDAVEYERQRLEAETAYFQHQAELVEWELHQAEIELEQDEQVLQQREQRIRMERSRLDESFTSIQRRVEETKQEARNRQKITSMEKKFIKYKIARCKEEERFEQELEHLKQDEVHIQEREKCEKQRQEAEKVRLKKELNQLVKVMNRLENAKELAKLAEEHSATSQSHETCVVCFEPLVNEDSDLGVVECGHTFHTDCWDRWEKSKRRRGSSAIPCPLCNLSINNVCVTMRFGSSIYCSSTSSLAKHFQKEEGRWQRRRLTGFGPAGEASSEAF